ncbi:MAG: DUF433 domain-containing protein [Deltaproteobacteria bacterium]|nr:DUF433 domain-containing protein [Deltaproteobacteria bacterium]
MDKKKEYRDRIVIDSNIHFGKPCVAGTRVPVENVLELIQEGITFEEIVRNYYTDLEIEDVKACARYATDIVKHEEVYIDAV